MMPKYNGVREVLLIRSMLGDGCEQGEGLTQ